MNQLITNTVPPKLVVPGLYAIEGCTDKWAGLKELAEILGMSPLDAVKNNLHLSKTPGKLEIVICGIPGSRMVFQNTAPWFDEEVNYLECFAPAGWVTRVLDSYRHGIDLSQQIVVVIQEVDDFGNLKEIFLGRADQDGFRDVVKRYNGCLSQYRGRIKGFLSPKQGRPRDCQKHLPLNPEGYSLLMLRGHDSEIHDEGIIAKVSG